MIDIKMICGNKIVLREKRLADAWDDYSWQTDPELTQLDAAPQLTISFHEFLFDYADELRSSPSFKRAFGIETQDGKHIGNCGYYDIDWVKREAELGIMIGNRDYWDKGYGTDAVTTLLNHILHQTDFDRIHLKTLDWNIRAQECFRRCGFTPCGNMLKDGYSFALMEIRRNSGKDK
jgi:RimJ/RimL family protein N-acetyltransferase